MLLNEKILFFVWVFSLEGYITGRERNKEVTLYKVGKLRKGNNSSFRYLGIPFVICSVMCEWKVMLYRNEERR